MGAERRDLPECQDDQPPAPTAGGLPCAPRPEDFGRPQCLLRARRPAHPNGHTARDDHSDCRRAIRPHASPPTDPPWVCSTAPPTHLRFITGPPHPPSGPPAPGGLP